LGQHHLPPGFEHFFARCADEFAGADGPDMQGIVGFAKDQAIEFIESAQP